MEQRKLLLIENKFKNQLVSLFNETVLNRKDNYKSEIDKLQLQYPIPSYLNIGDSDSGFCNCFLDSKALPVWFQEFLLDCYEVAQKACMKNISV